MCYSCQLSSMYAHREEILEPLRVPLTFIRCVLINGLLGHCWSMSLGRKIRDMLSCKLADDQIHERWYILLRRSRKRWAFLQSNTWWVENFSIGCLLFRPCTCWASRCHFWTTYCVSTCLLFKVYSSALKVTPRKMINICWGQIVEMTIFDFFDLTSAARDNTPLVLLAVGSCFQGLESQPRLKRSRCTSQLNPVEVPHSFRRAVLTSFPFEKNGRKIWNAYEKSTIPWNEADDWFDTPPDVHI